MPPDSKKYGEVIRIDADAKQTAIKLSQRYGIPMKAILNTLIDMCDNFDLMNPDFADRINAAMKKGDERLQLERHKNSTIKCDGLRRADHKWKCVIGRKNNTPAVRILAVDYDEACDMCEGCRLTLDPVLLNEEYKLRIDELEGKLESSSSVKFKVPVCMRGAVLNDNGTQFSSCPRSSIPVSVKNYCKVYRNGLSCALFRESVIGVASGESEQGDML